MDHTKAENIHELILVVPLFCPVKHAALKWWKISPAPFHCRRRNVCRIYII